MNVAVNRAIRYRRDMDTDQAADHWAAPSETLARQQGDCEDFAILKMAALRAEGADRTCRSSCSSTRSVTSTMRCFRLPSMATTSS
ncbi:transglutaminase-like cysteine peptidase [Rhizobium mongolense]|uniref:transglutaminase-like cysteine peptidase n=1 Tax=Rhizobium mongolense TaxID=57676 RepID=UPI001F351B79|nr:transglutaminase-like cysteine peptidase [Rhizobium mongolense]